MVKKKKNKVNRRELAKNVVHIEGISQNQAERIIDLIFKNILYSVTEGKTVDVPGFCKFSAQYVPPRSGSHPQTLEPIQISERVQLRASFSRTAKRIASQHVDNFRPVEDDSNSTEE